MALALSSCSGPQALSNQPLSDLTFPDTLGVFANASDGSSNALWNQVYFNNKSDTSEWRSKEVRLILLSQKRLQVQLLEKDTVLECVIFRGRLKGSNFKLNRQNHYDPLFYIVSVYGYNDSKIALDASRNLICESARGALLLGGFVLPFFGAVPPPAITVYQRLP